MKSKVAVTVVVLLVAIGAVIVFSKKNSPKGVSVTSSNQEAIRETNKQQDTTTQQTDGLSIRIKDFAFSPSTMTIKKGSTVTWTNDDGMPHTITSVSGSELDSGTLAAGKSFEHSFSQTGTYTYRCNFHSSMQGTITVTE